MSHHTAVQLLKTNLKGAEERAAQVARDNRDTIQAGTRAQRELDDANREVTDLKASIALLEKDHRGVSVE
jgi:hypothetical protein